MASWRAASVSSTTYLHRSLGVVKKSSQTTDNVAYTFVDPQDSTRGYFYNAAGLLTDVWYPSSRHVTAMTA